jgi:hypothetical protein
VESRCPGVLSEAREENKVGQCDVTSGITRKREGKRKAGSSVGGSTSQASTQGPAKCAGDTAACQCGVGPCDTKAVLEAAHGLTTKADLPWAICQCQCALPVPCPVAQVLPLASPPSPLGSALGSPQHDLWCCSATSYSGRTPPHFLVTDGSHTETPTPVLLPVSLSDVHVPPLPPGPGKAMTSQGPCQGRVLSCLFLLPLLHLSPTPRVCHTASSPGLWCVSAVCFLCS